MEGYVRRAVANLDATGLEYSEDEVIKLACDYEAEDNEGTLFKVAEAEDHGRIMARGFMDEIEKIGMRLPGGLETVRRWPFIQHVPPPPSRIVRTANGVYQKVTDLSGQAYNKLRGGAAYAKAKLEGGYTKGKQKAVEGYRYGVEQARAHPYVTGAALGIGGNELYKKVLDND